MVQQEVRLNIRLCIRAKLFPWTNSCFEWQLTGCVLCSAYNRLLLPAALSAAMNWTDAIFEVVLGDAPLRQWGFWKTFAAFWKQVWVFTTFRDEPSLSGCWLFSFWETFIVTDGDKVSTKEGWRNKQKVFSSSLDYASQTVVHSQQRPSFHCVYILKEALGINHRVTEWAVWTLTPPQRKDSVLCPDVISESLPPRLSTPLPSLPDSLCRAAIGLAPWLKHLNHSCSSSYRLDLGSVPFSTPHSHI